jgi:hypothetical protein
MSIDSSLDITTKMFGSQVLETVTDRKASCMGKEQDSVNDSWMNDPADIEIIVDCVTDEWCLGLE